MISIKACKTKLLESLEKRFSNSGFRKSAGVFYKKTDFGMYSFHICFIDVGISVDVTADVGIRFDDLENLIHENVENSWLTEKEKKQTFSIGSEFGRLIFGNQKRYEINNEQEIEGAADLIMEDFKTVGEHYLNKYSDLSIVFETLLKRDRSAELLNAFPNRRAMNLIGIGLILGKENLCAIADEIKKDLRDEDEVKTFELFVSRVLT